jgi:tight adherence protein C
MSTDVAPLIIALLTGLTVALLVIGLFRGNRTTTPQATVQRRVQEMAPADEIDPLERSFAQRVMHPVAAGVLGLANSVLPTRIIASVGEKIEIAGRPTTTNRFLTVWMIVGVCLPLSFALLLIAGSGGIAGGQVLAVLVWMVVGLYLPWIWLRRKAGTRSKLIARDLPDAIDLIITNVEAGLGMQAAMLTVSEKFGGPIGDEFGRVVREISVGAPRTEALVDMSERTGVQEMRLFARAVAQAEQTGIPVARVLRNHSAELREKRHQRAREQAARIPVKITFPTVLIMFPTLLILILGPVALNVMDQFGG